MSQVVKQKVGAKPRAGTSESRAQARLPAGDPGEPQGQAQQKSRSGPSLSSSTDFQFSDSGRKLCVAGAVEVPTENR